MSRRLKDRIAVVTGASRGIGRAVALELAREGAHVIAVARTTGALEELDDEIGALGSTATLVPFKLSDFEAIDRLGGAIHERWGRLDILVGNAGVLGPLSPIGHIRTRQWSELVDVNLTANWRLIRSLDPLLRLSDAGRAVFLTSGAAHRATAYWGGYAVTKAALEMLVRTYAAEIAQTNARANLFSPGRVRTRMQKDAFPGQDLSGLPAPEDVAPAIVATVLPGETRNGLIYRFDERRWLAPQPPAPVE